LKGRGGFCNLSGVEMRFQNFHRGNETGIGARCPFHNFVFQSPFRRGNGCYCLQGKGLMVGTVAFSPLFVGAMVATVCKGKG
jgi:hypothetical protein